MEKDIKLIVVDLDGTLLDSKHNLSERNKKAIRKAIANGVQVVIASGKTRASAVSILEELGIQSPGVFTQGLLIYNGDGTIRNRVVMDKNILRHIITFAEDRGFGVMAYSGERILTRRVDEAAERIMEYGESMVEPVGALQNILDSAEINKVILYGQESKIPSLRWQLNKQLDGQIHTTRSAVKGVLEVLPANSSKGKGVMRVMKDLNIPPKHTMAIGDGENDIEMLKAAGTAVAVGNAAQKLKDVANQVVGSNDDDGVAQAIEMFVTGTIEDEKPTEATNETNAEPSTEKAKTTVDIPKATDTKETEEKAE